MPAHNKRFGEIGGEVIIRISLSPLTVGDSPNCVQLTPQLRQAAGTLAAMQDDSTCRESTASKREYNLTVQRGMPTQAREINFTNI